MVAAAVDEVDGAEPAELDGLEALGVENGFFYLLHIKVVFVPFQTHQHLEPIQAVIAWMGCTLDVSNSHIGIVGLALHIISDVFHQISRMIDRLEILLLQIKAPQLRETLRCRQGLDLFGGDFDGLQFKDVSAHFSDEFSSFFAYVRLVFPAKFFTL